MACDAGQAWGMVCIVHRHTPGEQNPLQVHHAALVVPASSSVSQVGNLR